jgi:hypothetical protein
LDFCLACLSLRPKDFSSACNFITMHTCILRIKEPNIMSLFACKSEIFQIPKHYTKLFARSIQIGSRQFPARRTHGCDGTCYASLNCGPSTGILMAVLCQPVQINEHWTVCRNCNDNVQSIRAVSEPLGFHLGATLTRNIDEYL